MSDKVSLTDNIRAFADREGLTDVMVGNQNAETAVAQVLNDAFNIDNGDRIHAGKGFIQKNKFRIRRNRAGDFDAAAFTTGERLTEAVAQVLNMKLLHQLFSAIFPLFAG